MEPINWQRVQINGYPALLATAKQMEVELHEHETLIASLAELIKNQADRINFLYSIVRSSSIQDNTTSTNRAQ